MAPNKPERWKDVKAGDGKEARTPPYVSRLYAPSYGGLNAAVTLGTIQPILADGKTGESSSFYMRCQPDSLTPNSQDQNPHPTLLKRAL